MGDGGKKRMKIFIYTFNITSGKGLSDIDLSFGPMGDGNLTECFQNIAVQAFFDFKVRV